MYRRSFFEDGLVDRDGLDEIGTAVDDAVADGDDVASQGGLPQPAHDRGHRGAMVHAAAAFVERIGALGSRRRFGEEGRLGAEPLDLARRQHLQARRLVREGCEFHRRRAGVQGQNQSTHVVLPFATMVL